MPFPTKYRVLLIQGLFGATGGFFSWLIAVVMETGTIPHPDRFAPWLIPIFTMSFGMIAAWIGGFLVKAQEDDGNRLFVFFFLCGMAWKPVIDSGMRSIQASIDNRDIVSLNESTKTAERNLHGAKTPESVKAETENLADKTVQVLDKTNAVDASSSTKTATAKTVDSAVESIAAQSIKAPEASVQALSLIGTKALFLKSPGVAERAAGHLEAIAKESRDPSVKELASMQATKLRTGLAKAM